MGVVEGPAFEGGGVGQLLFDVAILTLTVIAAWRVFVKAGQPGWGVLIPFYNLYLICKIARRPGWWIVVLSIPIVNLLFVLFLALDVAKAFSKSVGFGIGMFFLGVVFVPILGFGSAQYNGDRLIERPLGLN